MHIMNLEQYEICIQDQVIIKLDIMITVAAISYNSSRSCIIY